MKKVDRLGFGLQTGNYPGWKYCLFEKNITIESILSVIREYLAKVYPNYKIMSANKIMEKVW